MYIDWWDIIDNLLINLVSRSIFMILLKDNMCNVFVCWRSNCLKAWGFNYLRHFSYWSLHKDKFTKYWVTWLGISLNSYAANIWEFPLNFLKGTNWTISLTHLVPFDEYKPPSPSSSYMPSKPEFPIPTIIIDIGKFENCTIMSFVAAMSWI